MARLGWQLFSLLALLSVITLSAEAQTNTYRLHKEASTTTGLFQLKTAPPDGISLAIQSANLKSVAVGEYIIKAFDTQSGVPSSSGTISAGSTVTFTLWMKKSTTGGTIYPRAKLYLNSAAGTLIGTTTGATALTGTLAKYTFSTTLAANVTMSATDRFYVWVGVNLTVAPTTNTTAELDIEGTANGNYDSLVVIPAPISPTLASLTPQAGPTGTSVTVSGTNFGATQGTSAIKFNGVAATPSSWSATSIVAPVPASATTGPVVVTVNGAASNALTFNVGSVGSISGTISRIGDGSPIVGAQVSALQSNVVKATTTSDSNGAYTLNGLLVGSYDMRAASAGFETQTQAAQPVTAQGSTLNFSLKSITLSYIYDEAGRLLGVVDPNGETATYGYDAVGNLTSISRQSSAQISVIEFTPNNGAVGTPVTISGSGYSPTPGQNTVKFNGVVASVVSSTATQIVTSVPAGATSGPINVTSPAGTATSSAAFTVGAANAPTITSFTPSVGSAGSSVTITGTNFQTTPSNNKIAFNGVRSAVNTATATSLTTTVPSGAGSGRITVTTVNGKATSVADFYIPPAPYTGPDVGSTGRIAFGETKLVSINTGGTVAMVLFDGAAGQKMSLNLTGDTIPGYTYANVYNPDGSQLSSAYVTQNGTGFLDATLLASTGTYTIIVDAEATYTGNVSLKLNDATDVNGGTITPGGAPVTTTTTIPGQNAQLTFTGTAGQRVSLNVSAVTLAGTYVNILKPDGTTLGYVYSGTGGAFLDSQTLPTNGTYTILVDPSDINTGSATLQLYNVPPDGASAILPGGAPVTITTTVPGQNASLTFNGAYGQRISINLGGSTIPSYSYVYLYRPDGIQITNTYVYQNGTGFIDAQTLPMPGVYTILVDPQAAYTGSLTLMLNDVSDSTSSIAIDGASVTVGTTTAGQNAKVTFSGTEGQRVSLNLTGVTIAGSYVTLLNPDGTTLGANTYIGTGGGFIEPKLLPTTGTFTILIDPQGTYTGSATLQLYSVPADLVGTITAGTPVSVTAAAPGHNPRLTFTGTYGQRISISLGSDTIPSYSYVYLLKPDGSQVTNTYVYQNGTGLIDTQTLSMPGTYTLMVDPQAANTGNLTLTLNDVSDVSTTITPGGAPVSVTTNSAGQNIKLTFNATEGQRVSLNLTGVTIAGSYVSILAPDGSAVMSNAYFGTGGAFYDARTLPATGTYTILVDPQGTYTGSATLQLYSVPADLVGTITAGTPVSVTAAAPGHNPRLTFTGTYGQRISISINTDTIPNTTYVYLYRPDGSQQTYTYVSQNGTGLIDVQTLSVPGAYSIGVDPQGTGTGSVSVQLNDLSDASGTMVADGAPVTIATTTAGQNAKVTFSGTEGQRVSLNITGVTIPGTYIYLQNPDGATLAYVYSGTGGAFIDTQTLPTNGTYTIFIDPQGTGNGSATLRLFNVPADSNVAITPGGAPVTVTAAAPGHNPRLTFTGTYGQRISLSLSGDTIPNTTYVYLLRPDGSQQTYTYVSQNNTGFLDLQTLSLPGAYTILVDPQSIDTGNLTLTLNDATESDAGTVTIGGAVTAASTNVPGRNIRATFNGTVGQPVTVHITNSALGYVTVTLQNPDGTVLTSLSTTATDFDLAAQTLPTTGVFTILIDPNGTNTGSAGVSVTSP